MKRIIFLLLILILSGCGGGNKNEINQHELYGKKRVDCKQTKSTDEGANVTQCANIRPDSKEIDDSNDNIDSDIYKPKTGQFIDPELPLSN